MDFVRSREEDFFCRQSAKSTFTLRGTFYYYYADDDFLFFFFFPLFFFCGGGKKQSKSERGNCVGKKNFSLDAIPRIDLTDLSLSLSLFRNKTGREEEEEEEERDDAGR
jgi:hypothetical protein